MEEEAKINGDWSWTSYKVPRPFVLWPISEQKVKSWKSAEKSSGGSNNKEGQKLASDKPEDWALNSLGRFHVFKL